MYSALVRHPARIITNVTGIAASAASFVAQAGDERVMGESATAMIHNAHTLTVGDHRDHDAQSAVLRKLDQQIGDIYAKRSGKPVDKFRRLMDAETYFTGNEALQAGLVDRVTPLKGANNRLDVATRLRQLDVDGRLARIAGHEAADRQRASVYNRLLQIADADPRYGTACHECGHAIVATAYGVAFNGATVVPTSDSLGSLLLNRAALNRLEPEQAAAHSQSNPQNV
jgi:enoyl-CoA hydratase/carnithine racemase